MKASVTFDPVQRMQVARFLGRNGLATRDELNAFAQQSLERRLAELPKSSTPVQEVRSCSWCHDAVLVGTRNCPTCGHRADVARVLCDCSQCRVLRAATHRAGAQP